MSLKFVNHKRVHFVQKEDDLSEEEEEMEIEEIEEEIEEEEVEEEAEQEKGTDRV